MNFGQHVSLSVTDRGLRDATASKSLLISHVCLEKFVDIRNFKYILNDLFLICNMYNSVYSY